MVPLKIESLEEQKCLDDNTTEKWSGNINYWTAGTDKGCKARWSWCDPSQPAPLAENVTWDTGQPDSVKGIDECIHLKYSSTRGFLLTDRNCSHKYILACQVCCLLFNISSFRYNYLHL